MWLCESVNSVISPRQLGRGRPRADGLCVPGLYEGLKSLEVQAGCHWAVGRKRREQEAAVALNPILFGVEIRNIVLTPIPRGRDGPARDGGLLAGGTAGGLRAPGNRAGVLVAEGLAGGGVAIGVCG